MSELLAQNQPLYPFVKLIIAGQEVSSFQGRIDSGEFTGVVIDFSYTRTCRVDWASNSFAITLFDDSAIAVESMIYQALCKMGDNTLQVTYGWADHNGNPIGTPGSFQGRFEKYSLEFEGPSTVLTIEGVSTSSGVVASTDTMEFPAETYGGRPDKIVEAICDKLSSKGISIGYIEPCEAILDEYGQPKSFTQASESYQTFIRTQLCSQCISSVTGEVGYDFFTDDDGKVYFCTNTMYSQVTVTANTGEDEDINQEEGGATAGSSPFLAASGASGKYKEYYEYYTGQFNNQVISFTPELRDLIHIEANGGGSGNTVAVDPLTNQFVDCKPEAEDSSRKSTDENSYSFMGLSSSSRQSLSAKAVSLMSAHYNQTYGATLEIMGDPNVTVGEGEAYIYVAVYTKYGLLHHSSGIYYVKQAEDSISAGEFITTLTLIRNNNQDPIVNQGVTLNTDGSYTMETGATYTPGQGITALSTGSGGFALPLSGYSVTSKFGYRISPTSGKGEGHTGIDLGASKGTPIYAAKSGTVTKVEYKTTSYGYHIVVDHGDGTQTLYAHCSAIGVQEGQEVLQGQEIGKVGSTGNSTGNHLHFEIRVNGTPVDPTTYLSF